ncbi:hypothetical protein ACHAWT_005609 [Skeletonema menzelii]
MESIDGESESAVTTTPTIDEAAVNNDGANDSDTADVANATATAAEGIAISDEVLDFSSFPENNNTAVTASNDFDLLGFGTEEKLQQKDIPVDDKSAANENELNDVCTEDGEKNDATGNSPDSDAAAEEPVNTEEAIVTEPISNQNDTDEGDLSNDSEMDTPESETIEQIQRKTMETTNSDVRNETGAVEDLLSVALNEPSATVVNLPESAGNEIDTENLTLLNKEEVINNNGDYSLEASDTKPNDASFPPDLSDGSGIEHVPVDEALVSTSDNKVVSDAKDGDDGQRNVEEMSPPSDEPTATVVTLPEIASNDFSEVSKQLNVATNNIDVISDDMQTNEVGTEHTQDDIQHKEEEGDEFQTIEDKDGINIATVQNKEEAIPKIFAPAETHTEEEAEWLSMGLTLGDALRQIVTLTEERDSALTICQEKDDVATQAESLLVEVQVRLEAEMNRRAESDSKARKLVEQMNTYEERLKAYEKMEDELEAAQANLVTTVSEKSKLELEIAKLREVRDESERKEAVLSNRLNEAKKKEANKSNTAGRLELDNEELRANLESTKAELESTSKAKAKLEGTLEKLKSKAVERVKQAETALKEERELNEERKRKMKVFVETKAEELREAKESANDMQKELQETRSSLTASREREESIQKDVESARIKYREVQRDMERMKRNAEALHSMGNNLEQELEKSANETEEHKKKRISAKHELMTMMRTLEVEKGVSEKLRESMKFTFAPKAQSQQQLLSECLRDLEQELDRLSLKLGKSLLPPAQTDDSEPSKNEEGMERSESNASGKKTRRGRAAKTDIDTERLISNLEHETQSVSKGIMALVSSIERMRVLLDEDNTFNCMAFFSNHLGLSIGTGEARHQRLSDETTADDREEAISITSFEQR